MLPLGGRADNAPDTRAAKGLSLLMAIGINALILAALAWVAFKVVEVEEIEIAVSAGPVEAKTEIVPKEFQRQTRTKPKPASGSMAPPLIAAAATPSNVFVMSNPTEVDAFGIGAGFGEGSGFGGPGGGGGSVGFFGSNSTAERVAFIIDVSQSLNNEQFDLIKSELTKSLERLSGSTQYQVIFFSGPAWFAADDQTGKGRGTRTVTHGGKKYLWETRGGAHQYFLKGDKELYTAPWISVSKANVARTLRRVEEVDRSYGTDWRHPLRMALSLNPKPDVVYFLTDGAVSNGQQAVDETLKLNRRGGRPAKINTIVMMQPRAEDLLGELADKTGGEFTVVKADGSVERPKGRRKR